MNVPAAVHLPRPPPLFAPATQAIIWPSFPPFHALSFPFSRCADRCAMVARPVLCALSGGVVLFCLHYRRWTFCTVLSYNVKAINCTEPWSAFFCFQVVMGMDSITKDGITTNISVRNQGLNWMDFYSTKSFEVSWISWKRAFLNS